MSTNTHHRRASLDGIDFGLGAAFALELVTFALLIIALTGGQ